MSDILIRGIPSMIHHELQTLADHENLSVNQYTVRLIIDAVNKKKMHKKQEDQEEDIFEQITKRRQALYRKYGLFADSAKLIREDRDNR